MSWIFYLGMFLILINLTAYVIIVVKGPGYLQISNDNELLLALFK